MGTPFVSVIPDQMTDKSDSQGLSPFAQRISSLFDEPTTHASPDPAPAASTDPPEPHVPEVPRGSAPKAAQATGEEAVELKEAVAAYLASPEGDARVTAASEVRVRYAAARSLRLNDAMADALAALARLGGSRPAAAQLGRELIGPLVASTLAARLVAEAPDTRPARAEALVTLGDDMVRAVADLLNATEDRKARHALISIFAQMAPASPDVMEELVADPRWFAVRNAVHAIGEAGSEDGVRFLTGTVTHEHWKVRRESVMALQKIGGESAAVLVPARLEDSDPAVRAAAARATGALKLGRGLGELMTLLEREGDEDVIVAACRALGSLGDPSAVPMLEKRATGGLFSKSSTPIRVAAYQGLAAIRTPHALKLLYAAANDKDAVVKAAVTTALRANT